MMILEEQLLAIIMEIVMFQVRLKMSQNLMVTQLTAMELQIYLYQNIIV